VKRLLLLAALAPCAGAQEAPSPVALSAASSTVLGVPVTVQAAARLAEGETIALDLEKSTTDAFAITGVRELPAAPAEPGVRRFELQLVPLDLGQSRFPLAWTLTSAGATRAVSAVLPLEVREPPGLGKAASVKDIKPPRRAWPALWPWLLLAAALAGLGFWVRRRQRRLRQLAAAGPPPDARPPEVIVEAELASLEASGLWGLGRHKEFYGLLTEALRRYLERRLAFTATRETTTEIHRRLRALQFDRALLTVFKDLFERADLVKFSKISAEPDWGASDLSAARRLVRETTPQDLAAPASPGAKPPAGGAP